jgi:hypothetical protein
LGGKLEILSFFGAIGAVLLGYWLGNRSSDKHVKSLKVSLYSELQIIEEEFVSWYKNSLLDEYRHPERGGYTYPIDIDWLYLNTLQQSLGGDMLPQYRRLFKRLKSYEESMTSNTERRNKKATHEDGSVCYVDYKLTAQVIVQVNQMLYFITKALSEKESFTMSTTYNMNDAMESINRSHTCGVSKEDIKTILGITGEAET